MKYAQLAQLRELHQPRRRWWHRRSRPDRCGTCGLDWPCPPHRFAQARLLELLRDALSGAATEDTP